MGAYGEASADSDVRHGHGPCSESQATQAAAKKAETASAFNLKEMGSRTPLEAETTLSLSLQRHWGLTFIRKYARLRLARVCYVGATCSRASSHSALDDHCVFSVPALHARLRAH